MLIWFCRTAFREPGIIPEQIDFDMKEIKDKLLFKEDPINFKNGIF